MWGTPEDLLRLLQKWPRLAEYIDADGQRSQTLREITEATLCVCLLAISAYVSPCLTRCVCARARLFHRDRTVVEFGLGSAAHCEFASLLGETVDVAPRQ